MPADPATMLADRVVADLGSDSQCGLSSTEAAARLATYGPNAVRDHRARGLEVLARQLRSPLLVLLFSTAALSFALGERTNAVIIAVILASSVGLGFVNEYRAEKASEALHDGIRHLALVIRDGQPQQVNVVDLVPGDIVHLTLGSVVPADLRLLATTDLECDESVLTGESQAAEKSATEMESIVALADRSCLAWMGTVVHAGAGTGVVVATGARSEFGRIAAGLGDRQPETDFQAGLRKFSMLLLQVAMVLTTLILVTNLLLGRPFLESVLFSLAIAVGITPQLLPAVVSTSLATGTRALARRKVLVKRLVCIEDLGDMDVLVTDKTGTLTEGVLTFAASIGADGAPAAGPLELGVLATDVEVSSGRAVGGNPLDVALWQARPSSTAAYSRLGELPFDHDRRMTSVVVASRTGDRTLVVKGAAEAVLAACTDVPTGSQSTLAGLYAEGSRVIAVASRPAPELTAPSRHRRAGPDPRRVPDLSRSAESHCGTVAPTPRPARDHREGRDRRQRRGGPQALRGHRPGRRRVLTGSRSTPSTTPRSWRRCRPAISMPGSPRSRRPGSCMPCAGTGAPWASWATGSTTPWPCTRPMSAFRLIRRPTWPRTPPTSCCWRRAWTCSPTASPRGGGSSPTPSSTC